MLVPREARSLAEALAMLVGTSESALPTQTDEELATLQALNELIGILRTLLLPARTSPAVSLPPLLPFFRATILALYRPACPLAPVALAAAAALIAHITTEELPCLWDSTRVKGDRKTATAWRDTAVARAEGPAWEELLLAVLGGILQHVSQSIEIDSHDKRIKDAPVLTLIGQELYPVVVALLFGPESWRIAPRCRYEACAVLSETIGRHTPNKNRLRECIAPSQMGTVIFECADRIIASGIFEIAFRLATGSATTPDWAAQLFTDDIFGSRAVEYQKGFNAIKGSNFFERSAKLLDLIATPDRAKSQAFLLGSLEYNSIDYSKAEGFAVHLSRDMLCSWIDHSDPVESQGQNAETWLMVDFEKVVKVEVNKLEGNVVSTFYLSSPIHVDYKEVPSEPPYLLVVTFSATTSSMARWIEILNNRSERYPQLRPSMIKPDPAYRKASELGTIASTVNSGQDDPSHVGKSTDSQVRAERLANLAEIRPGTSTAAPSRAGSEEDQLAATEVDKSAKTPAPRKRETITPAARAPLVAKGARKARDENVTQSVVKSKRAPGPQQSPSESQQARIGEQAADEDSSELSSSPSDVEEEFERTVVDETIPLQDKANTSKRASRTTGQTTNGGGSVREPREGGSTSNKSSTLPASGANKREGAPPVAPLSKRQKAVVEREDSTGSSIEVVEAQSKLKPVHKAVLERVTSDRSDDEIEDVDEAVPEQPANKELFVPDVPLFSAPKAGKPDESFWNEYITVAAKQKKVKAPTKPVAAPPTTKRKNLTNSLKPRSPKRAAKPAPQRQKSLSAILSSVADEAPPPRRVLRSSVGSPGKSDDKSSTDGSTAQTGDALMAARTEVLTESRRALKDAAKKVKKAVVVKKGVVVKKTYRKGKTPPVVPISDETSSSERRAHKALKETAIVDLPPPPPPRQLGKVHKLAQLEAIESDSDLPLDDQAVAPYAVKDLPLAVKKPISARTHDREVTNEEATLLDIPSLVWGETIEGMYVHQRVEAAKEGDAPEVEAGWGEQRPPEQFVQDSASLEYVDSTYERAVPHVEVLQVQQKVEIRTGRTETPLTLPVARQNLPSVLPPTIPSVDAAPRVVAPPIIAPKAAKLPTRPTRPTIVPEISVPRGEPVIAPAREEKRPSSTTQNHFIKRARLAESLNSTPLASGSTATDAPEAGQEARGLLAEEGAMSELLGLIMEKQKQRTQLSQRVFDRHYMHHKNALTGITEDSRKNSARAIELGGEVALGVRQAAGRMTGMLDLIKDKNRKWSEETARVMRDDDKGS